MYLLNRSPVLLTISALLATSGSALAHASDRGFVLLLPTGHYIIGGTLAVAVSFLALIFFDPASSRGFATARLRLFQLWFDPRMGLSLLSLAALVVLLAAGLFGSRDPLSNPLPLTIWTLFWVGLTLLTGAFGNLFAWINPWYGPWRIVSGHRPETEPVQAGEDGSGTWTYLPAIIQFAAFAWFELVYPAPDDPYRLAWVTGLYWLVNFSAMLAIGYDHWTRTGECFSVFFRIVSKLSVMSRQGDTVYLNWPAAKLADAAPLPMTGIIFLLTVLASVSFDGLMRTFWWLAKIGVNPLEFPGRSAVIFSDTMGLLAAAVLLTCTFLACVWTGEKMSGHPISLRRAAGLLVWSIAPIALAYHFAHYLTSLLVNGQYALVALSDPFSRGWNLFGTAHIHVEAGVVMGARSAWVLWNLQAGAIVFGHVLAVVVAHALAARLHAEPKAAVRSQVPLTLLMIGYTVLGLWLLSTPTGA